MSRRMTDDLSKEEKKRWQEIAKEKGLIRRTGISLDSDVGSMGQLAKYIARPGVAIVKRHKVSEQLPPDDVEVLAYGVFDCRPGENEYKLVRYSSKDGKDWYTPSWEFGKERYAAPLYWISLDELLEGVE